MNVEDAVGATPSGVGRSVYGLKIDHSNFSLVRLKVVAGGGSDGLAGNAGAPGMEGGMGGNGLLGANDVENACLSVSYTVLSIKMVIHSVWKWRCRGRR